MKNSLLLEDRNKVGVYLLINTTTNETYVGNGKLGACLRRHNCGLINGNHSNVKVREAFARNQNGWEFIPLPVYEPGFTRQENREIAFDLEQETIDEFYGNPMFLNIASDARQCGNYVRTQEILEKQHLAQLGKKQSPEHIAKKTISQTGKKRSAESKVLLSNGAKQRWSDDEARKEQSAKWQRLLDSGYKQPDASREATRRAHMKPVVINNTEYESLATAGLMLGVHISVVYQRVNNPNFPTWHYLNKEATE